MSSSAAARVLADARARIEKHGWVQGFYGDERTGYCMLGALGYRMKVRRVGSPLDDGFPAALRCLQHVLAEDLGYIEIPYANDAASTTVEDVLLWLKKAEAKALEEVSVRT